MAGVMEKDSVQGSISGRQCVLVSVNWFSGF